jgi:hypothetical protein
MSISFFKTWFVWGLVAVCGLAVQVANAQVPRSGTQAVPPTAGNTNANVQQASPAKPANYNLVGHWAGVSYLDEAKLKQKYDSLTDPAQKEALVRAAEAFLSLVVAVEYKANGTMESDVEMLGTNGEVVREVVAGTWRVVEAKGLKLIVEVQERVADKTPEPVRKFFQFYEGGDNLATPIETAPELADLNPLIVFERLPAEVVAQMQKAQAPKVDR